MRPMSILTGLILATAAIASALAFPAAAAEGTYLRFNAEIKQGGKVIASPMLLARTGSRSSVNVVPAAEQKDGVRVSLSVDGTSLEGAQVSFTATVTVESEGGKGKREESFKFKSTLDKPATMAGKGADGLSVTMKASRPSAEQLKVLGVK